MAKAKAKAEALLLAALVLTSCFAASSSYCIPRRLLLVSGAYYRSPCNDERMHRPKLRGDDDGSRQAQGSRKPKGPPPPTVHPRAMSYHPGAPAAPGSNN